MNDVIVIFLDGVYKKDEVNTPRPRAYWFRKKGIGFYLLFFDSLNGKNGQTSPVLR